MFQHGIKQLSFRNAEVLNDSKIRERSQFPNEECLRVGFEKRRNVQHDTSKDEEAASMQ